MKTPTRFLRFMFAAHAMPGLVLSGVLFVVCLSGTIVTLVPELEIWEQPAAASQNNLTAETAIKGVENVMAEAGPDAHVEFVLLNSGGLAAQRQPIARLHGHAHDPSGAEGAGIDKILLFNPASGAVGPVRETPGSSFLELLHTDLHAPRPWGRYLVGITGVLLLTSLISGALLHQRMFRDAFRLRLGGSGRLAWADVHNRIGVWGFPFHVVIALTGAFLGIVGITVTIMAMVAFKGDQEAAVAAVVGPQPVETGQSAPMPDLAAMIAQAEQQHPGFKLTGLMLRYPGDAGGQVNIYGELPGVLLVNETVTFAMNGEMLSPGTATQSGLGPRILSLVIPLHYANFDAGFDGWGIKLVYVALGAVLCICIATGTLIWLRRRAWRPSALMLGDRVWTGFCLGQLLAMLGVLVISSMPGTVYLGLSVLSLAAAFLPVAPAHFTRVLLMACAGVALAAVVKNSLLWPTAWSAPYALGINLLLTLTALMMLAGALFYRRPSSKPTSKPVQPRALREAGKAPAE